MLDSNVPTSIARTSGSRPKFVSLELTRFVCALVVCVYHVFCFGDFGFIDAAGWRKFGPVLHLFGEGSVAVFFVLSGFVIHYSSRRESSFRRYFAKRAIRIYPLFAIAGALAIALNVTRAVGSRRFGGDEARSLAIQAGINTSMLQKPYFTFALPWQQPIIGPMWSLSYEFWFYIAFGVLIVWRKQAIKSGHVLLAAAAGAFLMYRIPWVGWTFPVYFSVWWAGVELSRQIEKNKEIRFREILPYVLCLAAIAVECLLLGRRMPSQEYILPWARFIGVHFLTAVLVLACLCFRRGEFLTWNPGRPALIARLGAASYAFYLFHPLVIDALAIGLRGLGGDLHALRWVSMLLVVGLTIVASLWLEERVHRPLAHRLSRRLVAPASQNSA